MSEFYNPNNNRSPVAHICIDVTSFEVSKPFYTETFAKLGWKVTFDSGKGFMGFGPGYSVIFLIEKGEGDIGRTGRGGTHLSFEAPSQEAVDEWYQAGIAKGGKDNGAPGVRANIAPNYYAAFVNDPDGYRLEALYHVPKAE